MLAANSKIDVIIQFPKILTLTITPRKIISTMQQVIEEVRLLDFTPSETNLVQYFRHVSDTLFDIRRAKNLN